MLGCSTDGLNLLQTVRRTGEIVTFVRGNGPGANVPKDGHLPEGGLLPAFIEWSPGPHPSTAHKDMGITLKQFARHPDPDSNSYAYGP